MYSKIKITGKIQVVTGLHIGSGGETSMIGAIDAPVVRDPFTKLPIIPGSSIKGKIRSLLAKDFGMSFKQKQPNDDAPEILRLFGSSNKNNIQRARLQFSDAFLNEKSKQKFDEKEIPYTEAKFENTINRLTAEAKPRQIERVPRNSEFDFQIIYNVEENSEVEEDFQIIKRGIQLIENDYLGGGGTRGNGRVHFNIEDIETVIGNYDSSKLELK